MCMNQAHRQSIFCILPPHILREIAMRGNRQQREHALDALALDVTARSMRATLQLMNPEAPRAVMLPVSVTPQRTIYNAAGAGDLPGSVVRNEGADATGDASVDEAFDGLGATFKFYWEIYQRNSIDNQGLPLDATVHYQDRYNNAFWNGRQMVFGDGDGTVFDRFTIDLDVIGHELTHGVTGSEVNLVYLGQAGAVNESVSDVFGSLIKQYLGGQTADEADWLIGAHLIKVEPAGQALRSMKAPGTAYSNSLMGEDPQPSHMRDYVNTTQDNGGVHINSGIPNHAFYLLATQLGGKAWERAGQIWYDTIRDSQLDRNASFADFAARSAFNAGHRYGTDSDEQKAVIGAWQAVGVDAS